MHNLGLVLLVSLLLGPSWCVAAPLGKRTALEAYSRLVSMTDDTHHGGAWSAGSFSYDRTIQGHLAVCARVTPSGPPDS